jgi:hypothetical protein
MSDATTTIAVNASLQSRRPLTEKLFQRAGCVALAHLFVGGHVTWTTRCSQLVRRLPDLPRSAPSSDSAAPRTVRGHAEHTFHQPVPIVARIVWADDGEEHLETVALGLDQPGRVRAPVGPALPTTSVWLAAADVKRRETG